MKEECEKEAVTIDQPDRFDLELELVRWVKVAAVQTIPPVMVKPSGPITQHYGLDSKSRWREAVCVMMLVSDPHISVDGTNKLGRQLAQLFRQDFQLWEVKARQLLNWVKRGLTNVKLLDRTLAYFQNQSSWLQYIRNLKNPIPEIETPGFPGTQWSEFYWKEQTVMLLMQEHDFPQGQSADFCSRLFREEPGKWALKMDQFRRWLERGKSDPLPEYYGTGKNCPECGLFLWDARSFLKHMKRNHGVKIRDKEREREKEKLFKDTSFSSQPLFIPGSGEGSDSESSPRSEISVLKSTKAPGSLYILEPVKSEHEPPISTSSPLHSPSPQPIMHSPSPQPPFRRSSPSPSPSRPPAPSPSPSRPPAPSPSPSRAAAPSPSPSRAPSRFSPSPSRAPTLSVSLPHPSPSRPPAPSPSKDPHSLLNQTLPVRTAASRKEDSMSKRERSKLVSCPECNFKCSHSKIVSHLMKCKKAHQVNKPDQSTEVLQKPSIETKHIPSTSREQDVPDSITGNKPPERPSGSGSSNIVKKVFWKKFEADRLTQERASKDNSSPPYKSPDSVYRSPDHRYRSPDHRYRSPDALYKSPDTMSRSPDTGASSPDPYKPPLKLKLSRKEGSQEKPCFEINKPIISSLLRQNFLRFSPTPPREFATPPPQSATPPPPSDPSATPTEDRISSTTANLDKDLTTNRRDTVSASIISESPRRSRPEKAEETHPKPSTSKIKPSPSKPVNAQKSRMAKPSDFLKSKKFKSSEAQKSKSSKSAETFKPSDPTTIDAQKLKPKPADLPIPPADDIPKPSQPLDIKSPTTSDTKPLDVSGGSDTLDDSRRSRRGKMLACPLCGAEYAIASNLEKHIDRDHAEPAKPAKKRGAARKPPPDVTPPKKVRKFRSDNWTEVPVEETSPVLITPDISEPSQDKGVLEPPGVVKTQPEAASLPEVETRKLTEYEIFQNLQMKAAGTKPERRKVSCDQCGKLIPPNNIKRHIQRHAKIDSGEIQTAPKAKGKVSNLIKCDRCDKQMPKNTIKRHILKHKRLDKEEMTAEVEDNDDRIPCEECGKRLPKNAMKRHMMKHEVNNLDCGDSEPRVELIIKKEVDSESAEESLELHEEEEEELPEKKGKERKKISCDKCGLQFAPNTFRRHLEKHRREDGSDGEHYAPIEITPTKEYWEMQKEEITSPARANILKTSENLEKKLQDSKDTTPTSDDQDTTPTSDDQGDNETDGEQLVFVKDTKPKAVAKDEGEKRGRKKKGTEEEVKKAGKCTENKLEKIVSKLNKNIKVVQEQEKGKASGSEEEGETPLELAVRKVVSYKMTPKQALSIYNLTPKVLFDNLLGETDEDRMAILKQVDLTKEGEEKIIDFCRRHEAQLSYKSVINHVKELKHRDGKADFNLTRLQAYRWWYAFRKKYDLKITAKKK